MNFLRKHKLKLLLGLILTLILAGSFFLPEFETQQEATPVSSQTEPFFSPPETSSSPEQAVSSEDATPTETLAPAAEETSDLEKRIPESKPEESSKNENSTTTTEANTCIFSIKCGTILKNLNHLKPEKKDYVPSNGIILAAETYSFSEGDSIFDLLLSITRERGIPMEYTGTIATNSIYIEGIANLYEFDCGSRSGWTYRVNGKVADRGCSQYLLQNHDKIEFLYTCDWGNDLGENV